MPVLRRADLRLVNVECALGDRGAKICKAGPNMRYAAGSVAGLTSVPYHVACLGNNHVFDYGVEGYAVHQFPRRLQRTVRGHALAR
mgnify:CR=1 FL=1